MKNEKQYNEKEHYNGIMQLLTQQQEQQNVIFL
jgi:hypothetical protein